ncbi:lysM and putative peptidoglycan-binding domain-containing protein 2 [Culicoides brevitarsis]|uniref:lysM and putative peptidoglycan-binding domain-containing protein 2 n=1 Tax=Culicoides brevitarsis TaxID=469753 RepID=UPI00307C184F
MEETGFSETKLLMKENVRKYGSISSASGRNNKNSNISYVRHEIQQNDTLQGIALKYGVSMEQIKRTNRLLTTDTIFLRQYLMIPVPLDSPVNSSDARRSQSLDVSYYDPPSLLPSNDVSTGSTSTITASSSMTSCSGGILDPDPDEDIENFLSKVDSAIAVTKKSVEQTRKQSDILAKIHEHEYPEHPDEYTTSFSNPSYDGNCNTNGTTSSGGGTTYAGTRRKISYEGAYQSLDGETRRSNSRRHIKSSMHRLEKQQDDLFEL